MAAYGYGSVPDRAFVAIESELEAGAWKDVSTKKYEASAKESASVLLNAPPPVVWKIKLRFGIAGVLVAVGAPALSILDTNWDAAQRRLFHRIAEGVDSEDAAIRAAADRLFAGLLLGTGVGQTQLDADGEVDFGRRQIALTHGEGPLVGDAKKLKLDNALADVAKTTDALAAGLGRTTGEKRKSPSRQLRDALAECATSFNAVHEDIVWFINRTPAGPERDNLAALLSPLEALLARSATKAVASPAPEAPAAADASKTPETTPA